MLQFTTNQWAVVGLVLVLGWLLGLLSRSGAGKWRRQAEEEQQLRLAAQEHFDARIKAANARIAELEKTAPAIGAGTGGAIAAAAAGKRDDLSLIRGIGRAGETRLNECGIHSYRDITGMSETEEAELEGRIGAEPGYIEQERWREQAALLAAGQTDEHRERYGASRGVAA
jgi:predicted flap endonuclease-1-like 5' DNA nuclease